MFRKLLKVFLLCLFVFTFYTTASAQTSKKNLAQKTLSVSKKATVIIVGQTAKTAYKGTKFTLSKVAKPIIVKSAPKATKFVVKKSLPLGKKLFVKYIKYRLLGGI